MVAVRPQDAEVFCAAPPEGIRLFLVYGSDSGAVTERARQIERVALLRGKGEVNRFGSDELSAEPGRIADEAASPQLFGGEPVITLRVLDGRHNVFGAVQPLLSAPPEGAWLVVEAGELKRDSALLRAFADCAAAAAVPSFGLEGRDWVSFLQNAAAEAGMSLDPEAVELLAEHLSADRLAARSELAKLFLYVGEAGRVRPEDVQAVVAEAGELRPDQLIDAALMGEGEALESGLERLRAEGGSAAALASQALRSLIQVSSLRSAVEAGTPLAAALDRARPPLFARRRAATEAVVRRWPAADLAWARRRIAEAILASRRLPALDIALVSEALHGVAGRARRLGRGDGR